MVVVHDLIVLLLEVIVFVVNFLLIRLFLVFPLFATRVIVASIVPMATVMLLFVVIAPVTLMVVAVLATLMPVVQVTAVSDRKMSRLLLFWLLFLLELVKDAARIIGSLILLGYEPKRIRGHHFVHFCKLVLMRLGLCMKDLFAFLLRCGQLHCLTKVAAIKVAEEQHSMLHEFMHQHERGLLGSAKPTN